MGAAGQTNATERRRRFAAPLFALFVLPFASSLLEAAPTAESLRKTQRDRDILFRNMKTTTTEYTFDYVVIWLKPGSLPGINVPVPVSHIRFNSTVFFKFNQSTIEPVAETIIREMAKTLLQDKSLRSVLAVGHTNSIGTDEYNASLSLNRAVAVAAKLRENGLNDEHLGVVPMGEAQPITTNSTPRGRALNRRVEFFVSDIPGATRKVIEGIPYNPCHRNDHDGLRDGDCGTGPVRIPVYAGSSGQGRPVVTLDLTREPLPPVQPTPTTRDPLPNETLQRPSIKELQPPQ